MTLVLVDVLVSFSGTAVTSGHTSTESILPNFVFIHFAVR